MHHSLNCSIKPNYMNKISREREMDISEEEKLKGQAEIWKHMFAFVDSMALKCAIELGIPDIINSHGCPVTMSEIINSLKTATPSSSSPNVEYLTRIMRLLVHNGVFSSHHQESDEMLYDLTRSSKWLLKDSEFNLANVFLFETDPIVLKPWHYLGKCVRESGTFPFEEAYGCRIWEYAATNPQFNDFLRIALQGTISTVINEMIVAYKDGFNSITTLVDVGGNTGSMIAQIVEAYSHIQGINFDLPHAVAVAPDHPGVKHVGGDMFDHIPEADAIIMKTVLHDWNDEYCSTILKNCYKAISKKKNGKVILVECVIQPDKADTFDKVGLMFDLVMIAITSAGKERTEDEWKILLNSAGFPRYNIIKTTGICSIIEAFPE